MRNRADFELEAVLTCLERVSQGLAPAAEESRAIELAARALHYISTRDDLDEEFRRHLEICDQPAADVIQVEHEFQSMDEARRWLDSLAPPRAGTLVSIAGATHVVARQSVSHWCLARTLSPRELDGLPKD